MRLTDSGKPSASAAKTAERTVKGRGLGCCDDFRARLSYPAAKIICRRRLAEKRSAPLEARTCAFSSSELKQAYSGRAHSCSLFRGTFYGRGGYQLLAVLKTQFGQRACRRFGETRGWVGPRRIAGRVGPPRFVGGDLRTRTLSAAPPVSCPYVNRTFFLPYLLRIRRSDRVAEGS